MLEHLLEYAVLELVRVVRVFNCLVVQFLSSWWRYNLWRPHVSLRGNTVARNRYWGLTLLLGILLTFSIPQFPIPNLWFSQHTAPLIPTPRQIWKHTRSLHTFVSIILWGIYDKTHIGGSYRIARIKPAEYFTRLNVVWASFLDA